MNTMRPRSLRVIPLLLVACALSLPARGEDTIAVVPENPDAVESLDEIVVTGRVDSLSSAKKAVVAAEDRFYARYNKINSDDMLDIVCRVEARTGTRIKKRSCQARLVDEFNLDEARRLLGKENDNVRLMSAASLQVELKAHTLKLLRMDQELLRALLERARLEQHYNTLRASKFRNRLVVWD